MWNAETGAAGPTLNGHTDRVTSAVKFSRDGTLLVSSSLVKHCAWNALDGTLTGVIETPVAVDAVELSGDGSSDGAAADSDWLLVSGGRTLFGRTVRAPEKLYIVAESASTCCRS